MTGATGSAEAVYKVAPDGRGHDCLWLFDGEDDATPQVLLEQLRTDPAVWDAAVRGLTGTAAQAEVLALVSAEMVRTDENYTPGEEPGEVTPSVKWYAADVARYMARVADPNVTALTQPECRCAPCPGRGNDGHGMPHCAECCFGSCVEAEIDCPIHGTNPAFNALTQRTDVAAIKAEALREIRDEIVGMLDGFPQQGRHTRARWAVEWMNHRLAALAASSPALEDTRPEGETTVEWAQYVQDVPGFDPEEPIGRRDPRLSRLLSYTIRGRRSDGVRHRRTVTRYPDDVGPWEAVRDGDE